jgi:hypothetical protein
MGALGAGGCGTGVDQDGETEAFALRLSSPVLAADSVPLAYCAPRTGQQAQLVIYNVRGARVRALTHTAPRAGLQTIRWDGLDNAGVPVASGVYFVRLNVTGAPVGEESAKLVLVR